MKFTVDFNNIIGTIKPMNAVGQPPMYGIGDEFFHYLTEAHIPYSRQHDTGGGFGGNKFVDIPNVFRDFDADENDPASYDFGFTDLLISGLKKAKVEPIYRLGVTIENYHYIRSYRIFPPKDYAKWARICEHVIRHYNEGWANGFEYGIKYWEIWNEPDGDPDPAKSQMWKGTCEQYFELYDVTSKHLKACFGDSIKVGGYASCGFYGLMDNPQKYGINEERRDCYYVHMSYLDYAEAFFAYIKEHDCPIDFFSWHSYDNVKRTLYMCDYVDWLFNKYGYTGLEHQLNEWNTASTFQTRGTPFASATAAAMMLGMLDKSVEILCFYDARLGTSVYGGLFNPLTREPFITYYAFKAFGELYSLVNRAELNYDKNGSIFAAAAVSDNGENKAVLISNIGEAARIEGNFDGLTAYKIVENGYEKIGDAADGIPAGENDVILLKNY